MKIWFLINGSSILNGPKECYQRLEKSILHMVRICRHLNMEPCLFFGVVVPIVKWYALKWHCTMTTSIRITGPN